MQPLQSCHKQPGRLFSDLPLQQSRIVTKIYTVEQIPVLGQCEVTVEHNCQTKWNIATVVRGIDLTRKELVAAFEAELTMNSR